MKHSTLTEVAMLIAAGLILWFTVGMMLEANGQEPTTTAPQVGKFRVLEVPGLPLGGGASHDYNPGDGGAGGLPAGGGGGGGGTSKTSPSHLFGKGGLGGAGLVIVITT